MNDDLVTFLRARLDEDERLAQLARASFFTPECLTTFASAGDFAHVIRHDPARVLRQVEAGRAILKRYERESGSSLPGRRVALDILIGPLRDLAAVYRDHPDYRPEWKP